jgi:hypothetical protein
VRIKLLAFVLLAAAACDDAVPIVAPRYAIVASSDLFMAAGQSNIPGEPGLHPFAELRTPPPDSAPSWSAFVTRYNRLTGRKVAIVNAAAGGSSQTSEATASTTPGKNWDVDGYVVDRAIAKTDSALALGRYAFRGILWSQGERDRRYIDEGLITPARYKQAMEAMIARFRIHYGPTMPFYIIRTGRSLTNDTYGWQSVRRVQEEVTEADPYTYIVYRKTVDFPELGLMLNSVHYNQEGWRRIGVAVAAKIARLSAS